MMNVSFAPWQLLTVIALTKHWSMLGKLVLWPKFKETLTQIRNLYELNHDSDPIRPNYATLEKQSKKKTIQKDRQADLV